MEVAEVDELNRDDFIFDVIDVVNDDEHVVVSGTGFQVDVRRNSSEDSCRVIPCLNGIKHCGHKEPSVQMEGDCKSTDVIAVVMDVTKSLEVLRKLLESQLQCSLEQFEIWLQDSLKLDPSLSLKQRCIAGTGMVQICVELKCDETPPRLNITDVLQPPQDLYGANELSSKLNIAPAADDITSWVVDEEFYNQRTDSLIPRDPAVWGCEHVMHWLRWAVDRFGLHDVDVDSFSLSGTQLMQLQYSDFAKYISNDPDNLLWTHLELLRKYKFVAIPQQTIPQQTIATDTFDFHVTDRHQQETDCDTITKLRQSKSQSAFGISGSQIQLWQFLLELLTDGAFRQVIRWVGDEGEFQFMNPEAVARLWGERKSKPMMNYEKLSRALRYYYDGDMIAKVPGKRFVYKFVCDLRMLLGYSAAELNQLVLQTVSQSPDS